MKGETKKGLTSKGKLDEEKGRVFLKREN